MVNFKPLGYLLTVPSLEMDSCLVVEKEIDKVLTKFNMFDENTKASLNDLIQYLNGFYEELLNADPSSEINSAQVLILSQWSKKIRETISSLASEHRDLHGTVSKVGKAIDKNFISDFASTTNEEVFQGQSNSLLNSVLCEHFLRQGMLDIAEQLLQEAGIQMENNKKEPFSELNRILDDLKNRDLQSALRWTQTNHKKLLEQKSSLEFKLHRLHFIDLLQQGVARQEEAIRYARMNFQGLADHHEREIQVLMGSLLFLRHGLHNSPYSFLLDPVLWAEICDVFTRDACALLGLSVESPLTVCVNAGCMALPALLNIKQVMQQRQVTGVWSTRDELPIEIDLGKRCHFHSIFACPILRQQSSDSNPPMRLVCGHVISKDALQKLASGNKLKCPYCPMDQNPSEAKLIHF